jgi:hypothetical protein
MQQYKDKNIKENVTYQNKVKRQVDNKQHNELTIIKDEEPLRVLLMGKNPSQKHTQNIKLWIIAKSIGLSEHSSLPG